MLWMYSRMKKKVRLLNFMRAQIMTIINRCVMFQALKLLVRLKRSLYTWFSIPESFSPIQILSSSFSCNSHPKFFRAQLSHLFLQEASSEVWAWFWLTYIPGMTCASPIREFMTLYCNLLVLYLQHLEQCQEHNRCSKHIF